MKQIIYPSFALGMEINKYMGNFFISPYIDYDWAYGKDHQGFYFGIQAGYYFRR